jgi:tetratricopeptide (TPR) repeat protein
LIYKNEISSLLLSRLYVELAVVYAQQGQEQEALRYLSLAQEVYPEHPEADPSFLYAEFSPSSMVLEEGLAYLALSQHYSSQGFDRKAWKTFTQTEVFQLKANVPERISIEIINQQAKTALVLRDQEMFCIYLKKGIQGANILKSAKRRREAINIYKQARELWSNEIRVIELADLFF